MERRELLQYISILTGAALVGGDFFLTGCKRAAENAEMTGMFTTKDVTFFDEVAETILPRTSTPGAKDAQTGAFIATYVSDCYAPDEQDIIKKGMTAINDASQSQYKKTFINISPTQRTELLQKIAAEAKSYNENPLNVDAPPHYFTLYQQLALMGFFTSEPGYTQVWRFEPVPGKYVGCIDYQGETAWANW